mgnify:FL=1
MDPGNLPGKIRETLYSEKVLKSIVVINLLGTAFGFYYYRFQFMETSPLLWIFVPDSPLATLAAAASIIFYMKNRQNSYLDFLAFLGNLKYGVWTVFVLLYMQQGFLSYQPLPLYIFLVFSHAFMALQAFLVLDYSDFSWKPFLAAFSWFPVNDLLDYSLGIHSTLPSSAGFSSPVAWVAFSMTLTGALIVYLVKKFDLESKFF